MAPLASHLPAQQKLQSLRHGVADTRGFGEQVWWWVWLSHQTTGPGTRLAPNPQPPAPSSLPSCCRLPRG